MLNLFKKKGQIKRLRNYVLDTLITTILTTVKKKKYKFQVSGRGIGIGCGKNRECYNIILVEEWSGKTNKV